LAIFEKYAGFDELVFKNRNQEYGAFILRKNYNRSVVIALLISIILASSTIIIPFIISKTRIHDLNDFIGKRYAQLQIEHFELPGQEILPLQISVPPPPAPPDINYAAPVIVDTVPVSDKMPITEIEDNKTKPPNDTLNLTANNRDNDLIFGEDENGNSGTFAILETPPSFRGGDKEKFREWVGRNTKYPKIALDSGIYGKVTLTFVIEMDGSVSNVKIIKGVARIIDDEAIKAIKASPKWSPGLTNGRPVRVRCSIPLIFQRVQ
jgi:protein TonB